MDQTTNMQLPLFCVSFCLMPFVLHFKWCFQGIVIWRGEKSHITSVKTVTNWTAGELLALQWCLPLAVLSPGTFAQLPPGAHIWMWLPQACFSNKIKQKQKIKNKQTKKSGIRGLGKDSAQYAVSLKLEAGMGHSMVVLAILLCSCCALCHWTPPTRPTNKTLAF